jgi:hypothetical protein
MKINEEKQVIANDDGMCIWKIAEEQKDLISSNQSQHQALMTAHESPMKALWRPIRLN